MKNGDAIRSMSDEELAELLIRARTSCGLVMGDRDCREDCRKCFLDWLREEAKE